MCLLGIAIINLILPVKQNLLRKSVVLKALPLTGETMIKLYRGPVPDPKTLCSLSPLPRRGCCDLRQAQGTLHRQQGGVVTQPGWEALVPTSSPSKTNPWRTAWRGWFLDQAPPWDPRAGGIVLSTPLSPCLSPLPSSWAALTQLSPSPLPSSPLPLAWTHLRLSPRCPPRTVSTLTCCCCCYFVPQLCPTLWPQGL